jgi:hypothetical protein
MVTRQKGKKCPDLRKLYGRIGEYIKRLSGKRGKICLFALYITNTLRIFYPKEQLK